MRTAVSIAVYRPLASSLLHQGMRMLRAGFLFLTTTITMTMTMLMRCPSALS
jgi:hypothetical protein